MRRQDPNLNIDVKIPFSIEPFLINSKSSFAKVVQKSMKSVFNEEGAHKLFMPSTNAYWFQEIGIEIFLIGTGYNDNNSYATDGFVYIEDLINTIKLYL